MSGMLLLSVVIRRALAGKGTTHDGTVATVMLPQLLSIILYS